MHEGRARFKSKQQINQRAYHHARLGDNDGSSNRSRFVMMMLDDNVDLRLSLLRRIRLLRRIHLLLLRRHLLRHLLGSHLLRRIILRRRLGVLRGRREAHAAGTGIATTISVAVRVGHWRSCGSRRRRSGICWAIPLSCLSVMVHVVRFERKR